MSLGEKQDGVDEAINQYGVSRKQMVNHYIEVTKHKWEVFKQLGKVCINLLTRGVVHDLSKYLDDEAIGFAKYTDILKGLTYGSDEYKEVMDEFRDVIETHYSRNSHHPEYYDGTLDKMGLLDIIEMVCDWKAATKRHDNGSIIDSIYKNQNRFEYNNATAAKILLMATYTGMIEQRDIDNSEMITNTGISGIEEFQINFLLPTRAWQDTEQGEQYYFEDLIDHARSD